MMENGLCLVLRHYGGERRHVCLLDRLQAAEMFQQAAGGALADARYLS